jgi:hypothetical protein
MKQTLDVVKGDLVELVRPGRIKHLTTGTKYQVVDAPRVFGFGDEAVRIWLICDDGKLRSFHASALGKLSKP